MPKTPQLPRDKAALWQKVIAPFNGSTLKIYASAVLAALTAGAIFLGVNTAIGITTEAPRITVGDHSNPIIIVVPAIGEEGYPVAEFCKDPLTRVALATVPGTHEGKTYELVRVKDGVPEMVTWSTGPDGRNEVANFYYFDSNGEQQTLIGTVDEAARECIAQKVGVPERD